MNASIFHSPIAAADIPTGCIVSDSAGVSGSPLAPQSVSTVLRRIAYIARFAYWTLRHRSTKHVAWVLALEGYTWN